ncbi:MAG: plasmid partition protein ParG [Candidatus Sulfotelmatobacter sp.]
MPMPPEGTVRLNINIDKSLHQRFKVACILNGERMTDVMLDLIQAYVEKHPSSSSSPKTGKKK